MNPDGSNPKQLTDVSTEASGVLVSPDAKYILLASSVYPEGSMAGAFDNACNKAKIDDEAKTKIHPRIYTSLLYRHWTEWQSKRRQHLLVMAAGGRGGQELPPGN